MKAFQPIFPGVFLLFFGFWLASGCGRSDGNVSVNPKKDESRAPRVSVITVEPSPIRDILVLPAETEAIEDVRLASELSGPVEWIGPKEGDWVKKGELIAKIDVEALKAALDRAQASFDLAEKVFQRRRLLNKRGVFAEEEMERSQTERTLASNALRQAKVEYQRSFLRAPISGLVNKIHVDVGEFVARGSPVADLVNIDKIKVNFNVPEKDVQYLRVDQEAMVTIDALPDKRLTGTIDFVAFKADPITKTFHVRAVVFNPGHEIRPGMIARVALLRRVIPDAIVVPLFSLVDKGGERLVFVEKDGIAYARTVTLGIIDMDRVQITKGLNSGENLIVSGQTEVEEGARVRVQ